MCSGCLHAIIRIVVIVRLYNAIVYDFYCYEIQIKTKMTLMSEIY